jgi:hypothetical protein
MKLWKATVEIEVLIASEEEPDDFTVIEEAEEEMRDNGQSCAEVHSLDEVLSHADIPEPWRASIPRGDADDLTCEQILDAAIEARKAEALSKPMPNQMELPIEEAP